MDDQRLEEIAKRYARENAAKAAVLSNYTRRAEHTLFIVLKAAIREALSSQEEELRKVREERDAVEALLDDRCSYAAPRLKSGMASRVRMTVDAMLETRKALVTRAESAEAELLQLREGMTGHACVTCRHRGAVGEYQIQCCTNESSPVTVLERRWVDKWGCLLWEQAETKEPA
jgi:hypothetical protein